MNTDLKKLETHDQVEKFQINNKLSDKDFFHSFNRQMKKVTPSIQQCPRLFMASI